MVMPDDGNRRRLVRALLNRHGTTYAQELKIPIERNTPAALFQLLCATVLFSHRISNETAVSAARALFERGWTSARAISASTWRQRTTALNRAGFARYDESTSRLLGDNAEFALEWYGGDLRRLREEAERDPVSERQLLQEFKGIGPTGADIFVREVQLAWSELAPFVDRRAAQAARKLGLPADAESLRRLAPGKKFVQLVVALVRTELAGDYKEIRAA
jgi:endonuclease III